MSELKLNRLTEDNQRLREDLARSPNRLEYQKLVQENHLLFLSCFWKSQSMTFWFWFFD
ncbi:uncharacterized protein MELLADRAFT_88105 [Melampsora larici-populina 98AG31]|uniref:Uncharacterized protein n=1 Tax=Melampsora larici-populina (strain 98AG31 / pathotype 3-4-7) TaxID=747676 RepID=F4RQG8_MELLP|nr:uncharacterized protein MELLADRAFT_88105 [Melampsora larici-populina 98AG31]EGG05413.1 hypothetical protein MELLADRAFT_88105 [Melampsora larici-populina 98AG31]